MAYTIGGVLIRVGADTSKLEADLKKAGRVLKREGTQLKNLGDSLSRSVTLPLGIAGGAAIKFASDYQESLNKVRVSFKNSSGDVEAFAKTTLATFGIAEGSALDMAALFGDMSTSMGLTTAQSAEMSKKLVGLAGDMASFKNINISEATTALVGVFTGETESLKRLGVVMTDTNVKLYAMEKGFKGKWEQATQAEKVMYRYNYVLEQTKNSAGDFANTSGAAANQTRGLTEGLKQLAAGIGNELLPAYTAVVSKVNELVTAFASMDSEQKKNIVTVTAVAAAAGPVISGYGRLQILFSDFTGKLLPDLIKLFEGGASQVKAAGIAGAVAYGIFTNWDKVVELFSKFNIELGGVAELVDVISGAFKLAGGLITLVVGTALDLINRMASKLIAFGNLATSVLDISDGVSPATAWKAFMGTMEKDSTTAFDKIKDNFYKFINETFDSAEIKTPKIASRGSSLSKPAGGSSSPTLLPAGGGGEKIDQFSDAKDRFVEFSDFITVGVGKMSSDVGERFGELGEITNVKMGDQFSLVEDRFKGVAETITTTSAITAEVFKNKMLDITSAMQEFIGGVAVQFGETMGNLFTGDANAGSFFSGLVGLIADFGTTVGKQMITLGTASLALKKLFLSPGLSIAGGIALVAISQGLKSLTKTKIPSLAIGTDLVQSDGLAKIHKGETIVPAKVAKGGYTGGSNIRITGAISGNVIALSGDMAKKHGSLNRFR